MKIGIFDSGVGGLITGRAIRRALPEYDYLYFGDTEKHPYGEKTKDEIFEYTKKGIEYLLENDCALIVIACNSASAGALRRIQQGLLIEKYPDRKVLGVVIPTIEEIRDAKRVGVLATSATVASGVFKSETEKLHGDFFIIEQAAPELASLIQVGKLDEAAKEVEKYLEILISQDIDTLVLGCTHYPLIKKEIADILKNKFKKDIKIISQDEIIPKKLADYLVRHSEIESKLSHNKNFNIKLTQNSDYIDELVRNWLLI